MEVPTEGEVQRAVQGNIEILQRLTSPVFFSTREADGQVFANLDELPKQRPLIFIGNHQTMATDLGPLIAGVLQKKGILIRGLAHPIVFNGFQQPSDGEGAKEDTG